MIKDLTIAATMMEIIHILAAIVKSVLLNIIAPNLADPLLNAATGQAASLSLTTELIAQQS